MFTYSIVLKTVFLAIIPFLHFCASAEIATCMRYETFRAKDYEISPYKLSEKWFSHNVHVFPRLRTRIRTRAKRLYGCHEPINKLQSPNFSDNCQGLCCRCPRRFACPNTDRCCDNGFQSVSRLQCAFNERATTEVARNTERLTPEVTGSFDNTTAQVSTVFNGMTSEVTNHVETTTMQASMPIETTQFIEKTTLTSMTPKTTKMTSPTTTTTLKMTRKTTPTTMLKTTPTTTLRTTLTTITSTTFKTTPTTRPSTTPTTKRSTKAKTTPKTTKKIESTTMRYENTKVAEYFEEKTSKVTIEDCGADCGPNADCAFLDNICVCLQGYEMSAENRCLPKCEPMCQNGDCVAPNKCLCWPHYERINNSACQLQCSRENCHYGECHENGTCICDHGFFNNGTACVWTDDDILSKPDDCDCWVEFKSQQNFTDDSDHECLQLCYGFDSAKGCIDSEACGREENVLLCPFKAYKCTIQSKFDGDHTEITPKSQAAESTSSSTPLTLLVISFLTIILLVGVALLAKRKRWLTRLWNYQHIEESQGDDHI